MLIKLTSFNTSILSELFGPFFSWEGEAVKSSPTGTSDSERLESQNLINI